MLGVVSKRSVANIAFSSLSSIRNMSTKVVVLGANGGIGQPLSMLLKLSNDIDELACYDIVGTPGVAADLSHVSIRHRIYICMSSIEHESKEGNEKKKTTAFHILEYS
jgi:lactate/malate dehydrogenase, NAD binding domain